MKDQSLESTNYDDSEFVFSWDRDVPMIRPFVISCGNCGKNVNIFGPRCEDKQCTNCGYKISKDGYPTMVYNDKYSTGHMNGRRGERIDYHPASTLDQNASCDMNGTNCANGANGVNGTNGLVDNRVKKERTEGFSVQVTGGLGSCHMCFLIIALVLLFTARAHDIDFERYPGWSLCVIFMIICCPYCYILYACFASMGEI